MFKFSNNYRNMSKSELMSKFRSENWQNMRRSERISVLQEVENRNAISQGRTPCKVTQCYEKGNYGYYINENNKIEVNVHDKIRGSDKPNLSYDCLDTIYHEGEHAHQMDCVVNHKGPPDGLPKEITDMCEIENARSVYGKIIDYDNLVCEVDSNNQAFKSVQESKDIFKGDPEYDEYLQGRQEFFNHIANKDMTEIKAQQNEAVHECLQEKRIDLDRHDDILLNTVNSDQQVFAEANDNAEYLNNTLNENTEKNELFENVEENDEITFDTSTDYEEEYQEEESQEESEEYSFDEEEDNSYKI